MYLSAGLFTTCALRSLLTTSLSSCTTDTATASVCTSLKRYLTWRAVHWQATLCLSDCANVVWSVQVLPALKDKKDEYLLKELLKRWDNHKVMVRWLSRFFNYLDR